MTGPSQLANFGLRDCQIMRTSLEQALSNHDVRVIEDVNLVVVLVAIGVMCFEQKVSDHLTVPFPRPESGVRCQRNTQNITESSREPEVIDVVGVGAETRVTPGSPKLLSANLDENGASCEICVSDFHTVQDRPRIWKMTHS